jgi:hypothetical protein
VKFGSWDGLAFEGVALFVQQSSLVPFFVLIYIISPTSSSCQQRLNTFPILSYWCGITVHMKKPRAYVRDSMESISPVFARLLGRLHIRHESHDVPSPIVNFLSLQCLTLSRSLLVRSISYTHITESPESISATL